MQIDFFLSSSTVANAKYQDWKCFVRLSCHRSQTSGLWMFFQTRLSQFSNIQIDKVVLDSAVTILKNYVLKCFDRLGFWIFKNPDRNVFSYPVLTIIKYYFQTFYRLTMRKTLKQIIRFCFLIFIICIKNVCRTWLLNFKTSRLNGKLWQNCQTRLCKS